MQSQDSGLQAKTEERRPTEKPSFFVTSRGADGCSDAACWGITMDWSLYSRGVASVPLFTRSCGAPSAAHGMSTRCLVSLSVCQQRIVFMLYVSNTSWSYLQSLRGFMHYSCSPRCQNILPIHAVAGTGAFVCVLNPGPAERGRKELGSDAAVLSCDEGGGQRGGKRAKVRD